MPQVWGLDPLGHSIPFLSPIKPQVCGGRGHTTDRCLRGFVCICLPYRDSTVAQNFLAWLSVTFRLVSPLGLYLRGICSNERSQCLHPLHPKTQDKRIHVIEYMQLLSPFTRTNLIQIRIQIKRVHTHNC